MPTALVIGGSRGIGLAIAKALRQRGWQVAITSRCHERASAAATQIMREVPVVDGKGCSVLPLTYHAADTSSASTVVAKCTSAYGSINALVNAAGVSKDSLLVRLKDEELVDVLHTNLVGPIQMCKAVAKGMMQQRSGSI
jgi:3-oxoacyl-[acyl-carrier protein] reductase